MRPVLTLSAVAFFAACGISSFSDTFCIRASSFPRAGCALLAIDYCLAPEHPFPAPLDDMVAAIRFVADGGLGDLCDGERIGAIGDSAGANLILAARGAAGGLQAGLRLIP